MSGNTIGGIAGGLIGFAIGGPAGAQWGWMIGSVVGGIVDPQTIQGAQWQNQQLQGSSDGLGRAVIFGTATVTGNLLDAEPNGPRIGKKTEGGKGGPEVERDTAILTYAIEICDSSELRGTKVNGVIAVWEDEKLVYDLRPGSQLGMADSAKWAENKKFYFGSESQTAAPELEAIHGSGNVPAYRGSCIMTVLDEDLMVDVDDKPRGRIPTYRFLVSACAIVPTGANFPAFVGTGQAAVGTRAIVRPISSSGTLIGSSDAVVTPVNTTSIVAFAAMPDGSYNAIIIGGTCRQSLDLSTWVDGPVWPGGSNIRGNAIAGDEWIVAANTNVVYSLVAGSWSTSTTFSSGFIDSNVLDVAAANGQVIACNSYGSFWKRDSLGNWSRAGDIYSNLAYPRFYTSAVAMDASPTDDRVVVSGSSDNGLPAAYSDDFGATWNYSTFSGSHTGVASQVLYAGNSRWIIASDSGFYKSTDNGETFAQITLPLPVIAGGSQYKQQVAYDPITQSVIVAAYYSLDSSIHFYISADLVSWAEVDRTGTETSGISSANASGVAIPDAPGYYVAPDGSIIGPSLGEGTECGAPLDQVVRKLHKLGAPQLSDAEFDLAALEGDTVRGYAIQDAAVTVAEACDPLRRVWTFDLPSYDGQIRAIKRGRDVDWTLPEDDLIAMDSDYEQSMQDDTVSLPRKLHLAYSDPNIDYKETTQISERYSADVRVVGEEKISMGQLVMTATEAKQAVVKQHKLAWLNAEDTRTLSAPLEYIGAVNSDIVQFRGRRYRVDQMRVEGLQVVFESAAYDRVSSYQSTAVGTEGVPPPDSEGFVRGPTVSVFMNLPVLRDADDKAGIYWAASGLLEGWRGALLQMSRDGVTFTDTGVSVSAAATIGTLLESVGSASRYGMDEVNQIMVKLNPLSPGLDSTDMDGLLREANSAAILYADGTAEIVQFLTATETAPREYTLSGLLRGRLDTTPGAHNAGASFVLLNDAIRFVPLRNDDVGATITFRAISAGTVAENNDSVALTLGSFKSLTEWEPAMVRATTGTNEVSVTWAGRGRLGSSRMPVHSLNFDKYRVRVTKSGTTATAETGNQYATVTYTGISEPYTAGVMALSRIDAQFNSPEGTA